MKITIDINRKFIVRTLFLCLVCCIALIVVSNKNLIKHRFTMLSCPISQKGGNKDLHSQGMEDYILSMVFSDVTKGTYVDVGANNPLGANVTQHFHLKGWHGINIEPIKKWYNALVKERPKDINLNIGISDKEGEMEFFHFTDAEVLSTFDQNVAKTHGTANRPYVSYKVQTKTLTQVLEEHPFNKTINLMKIDVEGHEREALEGLDFKKFRPQVFVIEATIPNTSIPSHHSWEHILLNNGYDFAMFDGLNRYYLAKEHHDTFASKFHEAMRCSRAVSWVHDRSNQMTLNKKL